MANQLKDTNCTPTTTTANFEYDDNEWDIGIGNLIIDLDADIEKTRVGEGMAAPKPDAMQEHQFDQKSTVNKGLKMKIKRAKPGTKHEIVKSGYNGDKHSSSNKKTVGHRKDKKMMDKACICSNSGPIKLDSSGRNCSVCGGVPGSFEGTSRITNEKDKDVAPMSQSESNASSGDQAAAPGPEAPPDAAKESQDNAGELFPSDPNHRKSTESEDHNERAKPSKDSKNSDEGTKKSYVDSCVGTTVATTTEPNFLGPCEPGTSVNLEGIVWHETEGVLVVNVTWRGKTYVGSLLDCSRLEWDYPSFSSSPTSDIDLRSSKVRAKRVRIGTNNLNVFNAYNESKNALQNKQRSSGVNSDSGVSNSKGRRSNSFAHPNSNAGKGEGSGGNQGKRKNKSHDDDFPNKHKVLSPYPRSSLTSPVLFECPQPNCSKKYKHINGLKYHQSHAHGGVEDEETEVSEEETALPQLTIPENKTEDLSVKPTEEGTMDSDEQPLTLTMAETPTPPAGNLNSPTVQPPPPSPPIPTLPSNEPPTTPLSTYQPGSSKVMKLKLKSTSLLLSDSNELPTLTPDPNLNNKSVTPAGNKKKNRRSPTKSPNLSPSEPPVLGEEMPREEVQSPAYSDISEEAAPVLELEAKTEIRPKSGSDMDRCSPQMSQYGLYSYYTQSPYVLPMSKKTEGTPAHKTEPNRQEKQDFPKDCHQKVCTTTKGFYQYRYQVSDSPYDSESCPPVIDGQKVHGPPNEDTNSNSGEQLNIPTPSKPKPDPETTPSDQTDDNSQASKDSGQFKSTPNSSFARPKEPEEEGKRYYAYSERSETQTTLTTVPASKSSISSPPIGKERCGDKVTCRDDVNSHESLKTTMETQCSPIHSQSSQYTYIHAGYMQPPHYSALPFDPSLPVYRGINPMIVPSYTNTPYVQHPLHSLPRYHVPEDLSRTPSGKPLDLLHHGNQYYSHSSPHKIHELQERAVKSPNQASAITSTAPSASGIATVTPTTSTVTAPQGKPPLNFDCTKDTRSPPPQRHVHTHHHTHVGLGYPLLPGQYPSPYGGKL